MDDTKKMLRIIINDQNAFKQDLTKKFSDLEKGLNKKIDDLGERVDGRIDSLESNLTSRLDSIGKQLAYLEDDTPTIEDHNKLEKRVTKLEQKVASNLN